MPEALGAPWLSSDGMLDDGELLHQYAKTRSDDAFAELVGRRLALVYAAARRQL